MIEAHELTKSFGTLKAVRGVSFTINRGEAVGFLGPNGAGKTTTFRMMAGTLSPDSGRVQVFGSDLYAAPIEAKQKLGYMPENAAMYPEMTVREYLGYRATLKLNLRKIGKFVEESAEKAGAAHMLGVQIGHLSKGYRQRVALADALLGNPPALLLDEPTAGLDPNQVLAIRALIKELRKEHAVILSTHVLSEVEATCDRALLIHRGAIVASGTLAELDARRSGARAEVLVSAATPLGTLPDELARHLQDSVELQVELTGSLLRLEFSYNHETQIARVVQHCVASGLDVLRAGRMRAPLDEVFAQLTSATSPPKSPADTAPEEA